MRTGSKVLLTLPLVGNDHLFMSPSSSRSAFPTDAVPAPAEGQASISIPPRQRLREAPPLVPAEPEDSDDGMYRSVPPGGSLWSDVARPAAARLGPLFPQETKDYVSVVLDDPPTVSGTGASVSGSIGVLWKAGQEFLEKGRLDDAASCFQAVLRAGERLEEARRMLGYCETILVEQACPGARPHRVPHVLVSADELARLSLHPHTTRLLEVVDGRASLADIEERTAPFMDRISLYQRLGQAVAAGLVALE